MKKYLIMIILFSLLGCENEQKPIKTMYSGIGTSWKATIEYDTQTVKSNELLIKYYYLHSPKSLDTDISFSYGTSAGNIVETVKGSSKQDFYEVSFKQNFMDNLSILDKDERIKVIIKWGDQSDSFDLFSTDNIS
ncbi:hypothetical protein BK133_08305 [Paenibacillus sp. FSL H8-0548]|uniref:hypothetical protein n=1 Tax=Paenibacillus sp. FSL H8-0548 TaxID=1920422 RepID=UPI00096CAE59|nr:hypothetical protein [Paenibacillus sp. FSL H8-0548]OMF36910.1 hypothetical protein BK133_08305 [Paenibacillus sp. FSL H8-0548]